MTFAQRIQLGQIITNRELSEYQKFRQSMTCLIPGWRVINMRASIPYWEEVLEGIKYWVEREQVELKQEPTAEERAAGVNDLALKVGDFSTINALAKDFAKDPDEILQWKYGKVFNILYTNLQVYNYRMRLEKQMADKAKAALKQK